MVSAFMEMKYRTDEITDEIRNLGLSTGAELVGFASAQKLEKSAPNGHKPSDFMLPTA